MSTFKKGDRVRATAAYNDLTGVSEPLAGVGVVVNPHRAGRTYPVEVRFPTSNATLFYENELELVGLVEYINPEPTVAIDLNRLNRTYTTPLVLTIKQATELLRELDRVIL